MDEQEAVLRWRVQMLTEKGFSVCQAEDLAPHIVSWHDAADVLMRCNHDADVAYDQLKDWP